MQHVFISKGYREVSDWWDDEDEDAAPVVQAGDVVWHDGALCEVWRIGWNDGEPSPYAGDDTLRAYVVPLDARLTWTDWADVTALRLAWNERAS